jgi:uridine kinase
VPVLVGIAGGSGSGKTTLAHALVGALGAQTAVVIPHDAYYRDLSHLPLSKRAEVNFDEPAALDNERLIADLGCLRAGQPVLRPCYDFVSHTGRAGTVRVDPHRVVIVEGILALADPVLWRAFDLRVFVEASNQIRLHRRILRDSVERGRSRESVLAQYSCSTVPMFERYVAPSARLAHVTVSGEDEVARAVQILSPRILTMLGSQ